MSTPAGPDNPFAPPRAALEAATSAGELAAEGQRVASGRGAGWIGDGWNLFTRSPGVWLGITVVFAVMWIVLSFIPLGGFVLSLIFPVLVGGLMLGCRGLEEGAGLPFSTLFAGFSRNAGSLLVVGLLYLVGMFAIGLLVGIGVVAMMLPTFAKGANANFADMMAMAPAFLLVVLVAVLLMMPLFMALWFAPALVVFHDVQPMAAMRMSFQGCLKNMGPFLIYGLLGLVLSILATLPIGLGWLVLMPVVWGSMYAGYRDIFLRPA